MPVAIRHPHHGALSDRLPFGLVLAAHEHVHALRGELLLLLLLLRDHPHCSASPVNPVEEHRAQSAARQLGRGREATERPRFLTLTLILTLTLKVNLEQR